MDFLFLGLDSWKKKSLVLGTSLFFSGWRLAREPSIFLLLLLGISLLLPREPWEDLSTLLASSFLGALALSLCWEKYQHYFLLGGLLFFFLSLDIWSPGWYFFWFSYLFSLHFLFPRLGKILFPFPPEGNLVDFIYPRATYLGYWPRFSSFLALSFLLWGIPLGLALRSFHWRSHYLPEYLPLPFFLRTQWETISSLDPPMLFTFLYGILSLIPFLLQLSLARRRFFLWLSQAYYWLFLRFFSLPGIISFYHSLQSFLQGHGKFCGQRSLLGLCWTVFFFRPRYGFQLWLYLLPLDLQVHQNSLHWSLIFLPYWALAMLLWRSFSFLGTHVQSSSSTWIRELYLPPAPRSPREEVSLALVLQELRPRVNYRLRALLRRRKNYPCHD